MRLARVRFGDRVSVAVGKGDGWIPVEALGLKEYSDDLLILLRDWEKVKGKIKESLKGASPLTGKPLLPFKPLSFRDFMLWEKHYVRAKLGLIKKFKPFLYPLVRLPIFRFLLKPPRLFYEVPVYYMGNHLQIYTDGDIIPYPSHTDYLDYELEIGFVLVGEGRNLTPKEAERLIGGVVLINDFSARDVQVKEYEGNPFGPVVKAKNFATAISSVVIPASEILPRFNDLKVRVIINGEEVSSSTTTGAQHTPQQMVSYASLSERLFPGELLGSGTVPLSCGVEVGRSLEVGDEVELVLEGHMNLKNRIGGKV
ncbi:MAG: fumarylacetoacetate hydrolase family protein [Thermotogae bacterium]|nr:fumarylacetoacetate hydrolase family protein [Thermotogota bacterium]